MRQNYDGNSERDSIKNEALTAENGQKKRAHLKGSGGLLLQKTGCQGFVSSC